MMVDGAEEGQLKGPIDVLAPYTSPEGPGLACDRMARISHPAAAGTRTLRIGAVARNGSPLRFRVPMDRAGALTKVRIPVLRP
jgi:hypothetical protein